MSEGTLLPNIDNVKGNRGYYVMKNAAVKV
jgi:hypothetical protein